MSIQVRAAIVDGGREAGEIGAERGTSGTAGGELLHDFGISENTASGTNNRFAIAPDIPGHAEAWREGCVVSP